MGKKYTQRVADLCDAKVNASSGLVGHKNMGGNWELDVMSYPRVPFSAAAISAFENVLAHENEVSQEKFDEFMIKVGSPIQLVTPIRSSEMVATMLMITAISSSLMVPEFYGDQQTFVGENDNDGRVNLFDGVGLFGTYVSGNTASSFGLDGNLGSDN